MKRITSVLIMLCIALCSNVVLAQKADYSKYLSGAVPVVDGRVTFTRTLTLPGMSRQAVYDVMLKWMNERMAANHNNSRVAYKNPEKGEIVAIANEWLVFSSSVLSLDRTDIAYQMVADCQDGKCKLTLGRIRYDYRDGEEKYTAEEWITDRVALNKKQTKLVIGLRKWRVKTVDFVNQMFDDAAKSFGISSEGVKEEKKSVPAAVLVPAKEEMVEVSPLDILNFKGADPEKGVFVITVGKDRFNKTTLTADGGATLGKILDAPVVFLMFNAGQSLESLKSVESYKVSYYPKDAENPTLILECRKYDANSISKDGTKVIVGEILKARALNSELQKSK